MATTTSPPPPLRATAGPPTLRLRATQKSRRHRSTPSTTPKRLERPPCEWKRPPPAAQRSVIRLTCVCVCVRACVRVGITQSSTPRMLPPPLRAHISLVPALRATTRWCPPLWVTRTHTLQPATTRRRPPWPIRCVHQGFWGCVSRTGCLKTRVLASPGQPQSKPGGLQPDDAWSALSWRLQPSHPGLQH